MDDQKTEGACKCEGGVCTGNCADKPAGGECTCGTCEGCKAKAAPATEMPAGGEADKAAESGM